MSALSRGRPAWHFIHDCLANGRILVKSRADMNRSAATEVCVVIIRFCSGLWYSSACCLKSASALFSFRRMSGATAPGEDAGNPSTSSVHSGCDEIGRRKGLKIPRWKHRAGSIPASRTKKVLDFFISYAILLLLVTYCVTNHAGIAQLVERNLAKVEVESSRLFSRSRFKKRKPEWLPFLFSAPLSSSFTQADVRHMVRMQTMQRDVRHRRRQMNDGTKGRLEVGAMMTSPS